MHLYASGDAYRKSPEKARKHLYIKEKIKFLSLVCIVCINIWGFLPFSRILYKGMMHTMHTRAEAAPERWNQAETEGKDVCIPGCIRMHTGRPECIHGPAPIGRMPPAHDRRPHIRREGARHAVRTPRRLVPDRQGGHGQKHLVNHWRSTLAPRNTLTLAPTGITALNVNGVTIHTGTEEAMGRA